MVGPVGRRDFLKISNLATGLLGQTKLKAPGLNEVEAATNAFFRRGTEKTILNNLVELFLRGGKIAGANDWTTDRWQGILLYREKLEELLDSSPKFRSANKQYCQKWIEDGAKRLSKLMPANQEDWNQPGSKEKLTTKLIDLVDDDTAGLLTDLPFSSSFVHNFDGIVASNKVLLENRVSLAKLTKYLQSSILGFLKSHLDIDIDDDYGKEACKRIEAKIQSLDPEQVSFSQLFCSIVPWKISPSLRQALEMIDRDPTVTGRQVYEEFKRLRRQVIVQILYANPQIITQFYNDLNSQTSKAEPEAATEPNTANNNPKLSSYPNIFRDDPQRRWAQQQLHISQG